MKSSVRAWRLNVLALAALFAAWGAHAQETTTLEEVTVQATRGMRAIFDLPASVSVIGQQALQDAARLQVNLSEVMAGVPGVVANNRHNHAQDLQISVRGFGARAAFGVRGVRLFADGIPATMPDGQGQVSHFALGSAERVEVLRGPFSALYGNSGGGVIHITTEAPAAEPEAGASVAAGSHGTRRYGLKGSGTQGALGYVAETARFETDGYRQNSAARRDLANARLVWQAAGGARFTLVANHLHAPDAGDPLGLRREQLGDPRSADASALAYHTRKTTRQTQAGVSVEHDLGAGHGLRLVGYYGQRGVLQFQATGVAAQLAPGSQSAGVVDLRRDYFGLDARHAYRGELAGRPLQVTTGINLDVLDEDRRGFQNFVRTGTSTDCAAASVQCGVIGAPRVRQDNRSFNFDQYAQVEWQAADALRVLAGVRHSSVRFRSDNVLNPAAGGSTSFDAWSPVAGVTFSVSPTVNLYATYGRGFETPTANELSYRSDGTPGFNSALNAATSNQFEAGAKARLLDGRLLLNAAAFSATTADEIVQVFNSGGKSAFQNAGRTRRSGFEFAARLRPAQGLTAALAYTFLDARYIDAFSACYGPPCATAAQQRSVPAGNRMPAIPRHMVHVEAGWASATPLGALDTAVEGRHVGKVFVNDLNSDAAASYTVVNWRLGLAQEIGRWSVREYLRIDNLTNRDYVATVITNEANGRFFEPAPKRTWLAGVGATYRF